MKQQHTDELGMTPPGSHLVPVDEAVLKEVYGILKISP